MPELPEMQALAERLEAFAAGSVLAGYEPHQFSALKTVSPSPDDLVGLTLERVGRRGKFVLLDFGGPRICFHLSQGGRVDLEEVPKRTKPRGSVVRFRLDPPKAVLMKEFGTERKAGWWVLSGDDQGPLDKLGPEPDSAEFASLLSTGDDSRRLHTMLRDQRTVAGLGRGYVDDLLHRSRLSPFASLKSLGAEERGSLHEAVMRTLADGLVHERRRKGGLPAKLGDHWRVHNRYGQPCPECGADLRRVSYESHEITYCPSCQTGGKILADRRMSRLIR